MGADVAGQGCRALNVNIKPVEYNASGTALGHYRVNHRTVLLAAQAANSRLFSLRNPSTNPCVITRLVIKWMQTAAHTAMIEDSLDIFKLTAFTVVDNTNVVTLSSVVKRTGNMAAAPNVVATGVTVAGAAAGMTGGTLTKSANSIGQLPYLLSLAAPTGNVPPQILDIFDDVNGTHPLVLGQNEGFEIENRVLLGAAAGSSIYVDCGWAEVSSF